MNLKQFFSSRTPRLITTGVIVVCAVFLFGGLWGSKASAAVGANGKILYASSSGDDYDIFSMDADGSNKVNLTNNSVFDDFPHWSPDGTKIVFESDRDDDPDKGEIYVMDADGSNVVRLTNNPADDYYPKWSPDGSKIIFNSDRDQAAGEVYIMNADGTNVERLTNNTSNEWYATFSPDGSKISLSSDSDGDYDIYILDPDGTNPVNITNDSTDDDFSFGWSPDGSKILMYSLRDDAGGEIYTITPNGSDVNRLTNNTAYDDYPVFSPDGTKIVFLSDRAGVEYYIYSMDSNGDNVIPLNTEVGTNNFPYSWQYLNIAPQANADTASTRINTAVNIDVLANDSDNVSLDSNSLSIATDPADGLAEVVNGQVRYTPNTGFAGTDSFTYQICDTATPPLCSSATVTVTVLPGLPNTGDENRVKGYILFGVIAGLGGLVLVQRFSLR